MSHPAERFLRMMICSLLCGASFCEGLKGNVADYCLDLKVSVQKLTVVPYLLEGSRCTRNGKFITQKLLQSFSVSRKTK